MHGAGAVPVPDAAAAVRDFSQAEKGQAGPKKYRRHPFRFLREGPRAKPGQNRHGKDGSPQPKGGA